MIYSSFAITASVHWARIILGLLVYQIREVKLCLGGFGVLGKVVIREFHRYPGSFFIYLV